MEIILAILLFPIKVVKKVGNALKKPLKPITNVFETFCIGVYRFFRYAYVGFLTPFKALASGTKKMEEYERQLRKEKSKQAKLKAVEREKNREAELLREQESAEAAKELAAQQAEFDRQNAVVDELIQQQLEMNATQAETMSDGSIVVPPSVDENSDVEPLDLNDVGDGVPPKPAAGVGMTLSDIISPETEAEDGEEDQKPKKIDKDAWILEEEEEEKKKGIGDHINAFLEKIFAIPVGLVRNAKKKNAKAAEERAKKKGDINRQAMVLDFQGEDSDREENKVMWEYVCKNPEGKTVKGYFAAHSKIEVHSFLTTQGMIIYSIRTNKWIQTMYNNVNGNGAKIKRKDLIFFLTQLSTYIKSGIPLVEAMNILIRQFKDKNYQRMFRSMMYDLTMGESFSKAMENQGNSFPPILINMVKSSELTGELPEALDDMCEYFTQVEEARKEMVSALTYPTIVFIMAIAVSIFMMMYIVPQFAEMFTAMENAEIPAITKFVMGMSDFLEKNLLWLILWVIIIVTLIMYLYKNVKVTRTGMQWLMMHIPVMGEIMIYNETAMFSKTFSNLLSHNVFITDSMKVLKKITNNEIYKTMIFETVNNLAAGEKISAAFKDQWAFPVPAYEMIVTGEKTGQLAEMMAKVSSYYQSEHKNAVTRVKALMEPIIIVFLTVVVGGIVLAIVIPMFSMYNAVQNM